jgi:hypothetical protein
MIHKFNMIRMINVFPEITYFQLNIFIGFANSTIIIAPRILVNRIENFFLVSINSFILEIARHIQKLI